MAETSATTLGAQLRALRGKLTQEAVTRHAKRHGYYVHRPDLSAIENGRRLPTSTELRGILLAVERPDRFDELDELHRRLQDPPTPKPRPWLLAVAVVVVLCLAGALFVVLRDGGPRSLDREAAIAAARESPLCGESLTPRPGAKVTVLAQERGPADALVPNRLVEVRAHHDPENGWLAWAHLEISTNPRDRLWLDWSYLALPAERQEWRMCGAHNITAGPDSPAVKGVDAKNRRRWVRACGQAPEDDRPPGSKRSSFCTSWVPVEP